MPTTANFFEADDQSLEQVLFLTQRKFRVPRYQRPYTWEEEQISQFWDDLASSDAPFFLGSFIFNVEREEEDGFVDIIDGQQRLLTITIFCAVLRDHAKALDKTEAEYFHRHDIVFEDRNERRQTARIHPAESLAALFKNHIQNFDGNLLKSDPKTPEEERIKNAYEFFHEKLAGELQKSSEKKVQIAH